MALCGVPVKGVRGPSLGVSIPRGQACADPTPMETSYDLTAYCAALSQSCMMGWVLHYWSMVPNHRLVKSREFGFEAKRWLATISIDIFTDIDHILQEWRRKVVRPLWGAEVYCYYSYKHTYQGDPRGALGTRIYQGLSDQHVFASWIFWRTW